MPTTTSAPNLPGASNFTKLNISAATATFIWLSFAFLMNDFISLTNPSLPGYWSIAPKNSDEKSKVSSLPTTNSTPIGFALVCKRDKVWGKIASETKNLLTLFFFWSLSLTANNKLIASAAAVLSSKRDALASSIPVRSVTIVWKFNNASKRPWAISAW